MTRPPSNHTALMAALADQHGTIAELIGDRPFHYVDLPVHGNIGDLLIMHGTLAFFKKHQLVPRVSAPALSYTPQWIGRHDAIVFHGGGNFGDLYSAYGMQALRETVACSRPQNRIIVMPQSLYFSSPAERQRSARLFRMHPDVHLCVRDHASYRIALEFTDHVYLLPDMAHQLYPMAAAHAAAAGTLRISRMDDEKTASGDLAALEIALTTDWPLLVGDDEQCIESFRRALRGMHRLGMGWGANKLLSGLWTAYSGKLIGSAVALFATHERIVTDRLHGHILACLMDKPNIVLDNSYGKNSGYVGAWTAASELVSLQPAS